MKIGDPLQQSAHLFNQQWLANLICSLNMLLDPERGEGEVSCVPVVRPHVDCSIIDVGGGVLGTEVLAHLSKKPLRNVRQGRLYSLKTSIHRTWTQQQQSNWL